MLCLAYFTTCSMIIEPNLVQFVPPTPTTTPLSEEQYVLFPQLFGRFVYLVACEDQGLFVIWGWGWYFRNTDCCPATHFHSLLSFGDGNWGIA